MRLVIMQPSYLPWLGYFDLLLQSDLFLVYDNVQYDKDGWRNRNRIKTANGAQWVTVPVLTKGLNRPTNKEIQINNKEPWARKHLMSMKMNYAKAPHFGLVYPIIEEILSRPWEHLIDLNLGCLKMFCDFLEIKTPVSLVSDLNLSLSEGKTEKLVEICRHMKADEFYEPAAGSQYIDAQQFEASEIKLIFQDYQHPTYPQLHGAFVSHLSIVDLLFNCGKSSISYLKSNTHMKVED